MPGMEIFLRAPDFLKTAQDIKQGAREAAAGAAEMRRASGGGVGAAASRLMAANPGLPLAAAQAMAANLPAGALPAAASTGESARVDRMLMRSAVLGDSLMRRAAALRASQEADPGTNLTSNLFGRRARLFGMGGMNPGAVLARVGAALEEISPAAAAAAGALLIVERAMSEGLERAKELGAAASVSGGTAAQVTTLAAIGIDPNAVASKAMALRQRLASDPYAISAGRSIGLGAQVPMPFGSQNVAATYLQALEGLRKMGEGEEQLRRARMLGLEADLQLVNVSNRVWESMRGLAGAEKDLYDPEFLRNARDFAATQGQVSSAWHDLGASMAKPLAPGVTESLQNLEGMLVGASQAIGTLTSPITWWNEQAAKFDREAEQFGLGKAWGNFLKRAMGVPVDEDNRNSVQSDHADAMREHTRFLKEGIYGGGSRTAGAIPSALRGQALREAVDGQNLTFGAWSV